MREAARLQAAIEIVDAVLRSVAEGGAAADVLVQRYFATRRYAACSRVMGLVAEGEGDQSAVVRLVEELVRLNHDLEVPTPASHGIDGDRWHDLIPAMCEQALASGSPANNPRVPTIEEMSQLYRQVWSV
jgi:alcohol dehydrogenase class IV